MRRAVWLFPCWMACTSASPPPEAAGSSKEAEPSPEAAPEAAPICELGTTRPCYPGPEGTAGVGACKAGVETCKGTAWGECTDAVIPAADEHCGTPHDEDCDGRSDDCPEAEVALAIAFTRDRALRLADWGGGLGIVGGPLFWVVEPGGKVIDVWEDEEAGESSSWERNPDSSEAETAYTSGAWPGALVRTYETGGTRAGYVIEQERWDGSSFSGMDAVDELLQWRYEGVEPWGNGHAIGMRHTYPSYDAMEQLDASTLEYGSITAAEQRALQRKVDRLLSKAKPRLEVIGAEEVIAWEPAYGVFTAGEGEGEAGEDGGGEEIAEPTADDMAAAVERLAAMEAEKAAKPAGGVEQAPPAAAGADVVGEAEDSDEAEAETPKLPQPPALPDQPHDFTVLSDDTVVVLGRAGQMWSWRAGKRRWTEIEPLPGLTPGARDVSLHAGADGELLVRDCDPQRTSGTLRRRSKAGWGDVPLPTAACPTAISAASDGTRWMIGGDQLWQRRAGDAEPWKRVSLPSPWKPRQVLVFDGRVWIAAEGEGGRWAVLVDRGVPTSRVLAGR